MKDSEVTDIESMIEQLRAALEDAQEILEELSAFYVEVGEDIGKTKLLKSRKHRKRRIKSDRSGTKCNESPRVQSHEYEHSIKR